MEVVVSCFLPWLTLLFFGQRDRLLGVTFDHFVPADDSIPYVLQINIIEIEDDGGAYANENLPFSVDPADFVGKRVLAVLRCCPRRKGTKDRARVNEGVEQRDERIKDVQDRKDRMKVEVS